MGPVLIGSIRRNENTGVVKVSLPQGLRSITIFFVFFLLLLAGIKYLFSLLAPFLLGLLITYLIEEPVAYMEKRLNLPRWFSVSVLLLMALILTSLALTLILSRVYLELKGLLADLPEKLIILSSEGEKFLSRTKEWLRIPEELWPGLAVQPESVLAGAGGALQEVLNLLKAFPAFVFNLFLSGVAAYFFSRDKEKILLFLLSFFPEGWRQPTVKLHQEIIVSTLRFLKAQFLLALITALLSCFFLGIFGFPRAGLISIGVGLLDFLPMIGPAAFFLPWAGWKFLRGEVGAGILLTVVLLFILGVREFAEVRLIRQNLGLHPLAALFSVYLGLKLFGIYGFFIGPLLFVIMRSFYHGILPLLEEDAT